MFFLAEAKGYSSAFFITLSKQDQRQRVALRHGCQSRCSLFSMLDELHFSTRRSGWVGIPSRQRSERRIAICK